MMTKVTTVSVKIESLEGQQWHLRIKFSSDEKGSSGREIDKWKIRVWEQK